MYSDRWIDLHFILSFVLAANLRVLYCSTDRGSLLVYGGEARGGRFEAASMQDQGTGKCCACRRHPEPRIFFRICLGIPDIAVSKCQGIYMVSCFLNSLVPSF